LPPFAAGGDWGFALRCVLHHRVAWLDRPLFRYRQHAASVTAGRVRMAALAVDVLRDFLRAEPAAAERVGRRTVQLALARRLARLAVQEARSGDGTAAARHLREASALAPWLVELRWRLWRLGRAR
jgi:hypothetical protein